MGDTLRGSTALVTGATKRIGREIATSLAREGANIIIHYNRSEESARGLSDELTKFGVKSWILQADFRVPSEYEALVERAISLSRGLNLLVNNASIFTSGDLKSLTLESIIEHLKVNAWVPFTLCRSFAGHVQEGAVVNLLDTRIIGYDSIHAGYIVSKQVLKVLTEMSALEFAPRIRINSVAPGLILPPPGKLQDYLEEKAGTVPLKRHGDPADIARAVVYLMTAPFVTGTVLFIDGGRHLREYTHG